MLSRLRTLTFEAMTANVDGVVAVMSRVEPFRPGAEDFKRFFTTALEYWPVLMMGYAVVSMVIVTLIGWWALSRVLERLRGIPDVHKLEPSAEDGPVGPVPVRLTDARFRYPGADHDALTPLSMTVDAGEHLAVTGANGSGKTTLMLLLSGREPTSGTIDRPGAVGLGRLGGTAVVLQHPESQVLGTRVADDVVWGLPPGTRTDVPALLDEVGLAGMAERDTGGLSGGELQRLAVAAALARQPSMLIADEITSMVDQSGREALMGVLAGLTERHRMALVQITHYTNEADIADRVVNLSESVDNTDMVDSAAAPAPTVAAAPHRGAPVLQLDGVGHEYASGTPWAKTALRDVSFTVGEGDGVLIHGGNGSGKSTLAWIMAGLTVPTTGSCLVRGRPAHDHVGEVAIAFQAARLQLMRARVDLEVASAAGFSPDDRARVASALAMVGLDPSLARRRIDQLSGGQMRRVVLAGLLARSPQALILDEPLAGLDAASQRGLLRLLADLRRTTGSDGRGDLARLRRPGRTLPDHPSPDRRHARPRPRRRREGCRDVHPPVPPGGAAAPDPRNLGDPRTVGRHQNHCGAGVFGAAGVLSGLGADCSGDGRARCGGVAGAHPARRVAVDPEVAVAAADARRGDRGAGRRQPGASCRSPSASGWVGC